MNTLIAHIVEMPMRPGMKIPHYLVTIDGFDPIETSRSPLSETARELIRLGVDPATTINSRTGTSQHLSWAIDHPLAWWAKWTITEGDIGIKRKCWEPYPGRGPVSVDASSE